MSGLFSFKPFWREHDLASSYDVVIIGGGAHGLATAYELTKRGITNVAVLEMNYIGAGGSGRNTTILRANYKTPEGIAFYGESLKIYQQLSQELDFNLLISKHGHLTLAHSERSVAVQRERAEANQLMGVDSRWVEPDEVARTLPAAQHVARGRLSDPGRALPPAGRRDPPRRGRVGLRPQGRRRRRAHPPGRRGHRPQDRERPLHRRRDQSRPDRGGHRDVGRRGLDVDDHRHGRHRDAAHEPPPAGVRDRARKPLLSKIIVSAGLHVYVSQTDRGEFLIGAEIEPYTTYNTRSTFTFLEHGAHNALELMPFLARLKILRQWTGYCDMTPDYSPVMGLTEVEGFLVDAGWGTWGFKASPICGVTMAELIATGKTPALIEPFALERFHKDTVVPEKGAAAVSH